MLGVRSLAVTCYLFGLHLIVNNLSIKLFKLHPIAFMPEYTQAQYLDDDRHCRIGIFLEEESDRTTNLRNTTQLEESDSIVVPIKSK